MSKPSAPFAVKLEGGDLELGGWAALEHTMDDQAGRVLEEQVAHASMYRQVFSSPAGRYVLDDLMTMFLRQRVAKPGEDLLTVGIRQGQWDAVARILAMIEFANTGGGRPTGKLSPQG